MSMRQEIKGKIYRRGVVIVLTRPNGNCLWCRRLPEEGVIFPGTDWQFPQGGIEEGESAEAAALRELEEETGAKTLGRIDRGITAKYDFPESVIEARGASVAGQLQTWFMVEFQGDDSEFAFPNDEFVECRWTEFSPLLADQVVPFKQSVYRAAIAQFLALAKRRKL